MPQSREQSDSLKSFWKTLKKKSRDRGLKSNSAWHRRAEELAFKAAREADRAEEFMSLSNFNIWVTGQRKGTNDWPWDLQLQFIVQAAVGTDKKDWEPWERRWRALREPGGEDNGSDQEASKESSGRGKWLTTLAVVIGVIAAAVSIYANLFRDSSKSAGDTGDAHTATSTSTSSTDTNFRCRGEDCKGKNPKDFKCDVGAEASFADTFDAEPYQGIVVQIKYSKTCRAIWAKMAGGKVGDTIEIYNDNGDVMSDKVLENDNKYTPMLPASAGTQVRACVTRGKSAPECTTYVPMPER